MSTLATQGPRNSTSFMSGEQLERLALVLARTTQAAAASSLQIRGKGLQDRKSKSSRDGDEQRPRGDHQPAINSQTLVKELMSVMGNELQRSALGLIPEARIVTPESARLADVASQLMTRAYLPLLEAVGNGTHTVELVGRPIDGRTVVLRGNEGATVSLLMAGPKGTFDFQAGMSWKGQEPQLLVIIYPAKLNLDVRAHIPKLDQSTKIFGDSSGLAWLEGLRRALGESAELHPPEAFELITSGKDKLVKLPPKLAKAGPTEVFAGSLIPPTISLLLDARPTRAFIGVMSANAAVLLAALARCLGGVFLACELSIGGAPLAASAPLDEVDSSDGPEDQDESASAKPASIPISELTARGDWKQGGDFVRSDVLVAVTGVTASSPIAPALGTTLSQLVLETWLVWSQTGEIWTIRRSFKDACWPDVEGAAWRPSPLYTLPPGGRTTRAKAPAPGRARDA